MEFAVLGPLRVVGGGREIDLGGRRQQCVLAVLLAVDGRYLTTDRIIHEVWGENAPATAPHVISTYVSNLNRTLGARIESDGSHYRLDSSADLVDSNRLRDRIGEAATLRSTDPAGAVDALEQADGLWRGRPFGALADGSDLLESKATELAELRLQGTEMRIEIELERGNHRRVVPELEAMTRDHPYHEPLHRSLMLALYRSGRQAEAVRAGYGLRRRLIDELGIEPSVDTRALEDRILRQDPALDLAPPSNLPAPVTSFVGRDLEVAMVSKRLDVHRAVTLTGMGGIGKTRLAIECAERMRASFPDGVWFVDFSSLEAGEPAAPKVRETLGLMDQPGVDEFTLIRRFVAGRHLLLVLDTCEHVVDDVAALIDAVLPVAPRLSVLVTSRKALNTLSEVRFEVPGMSLPSESPAAEITGMSDAERLFFERASQVDGDLPGDVAAASAVVDLCRALEGVPLAIELAASRSATLSPSEILDRLGDEMRVLESPHPRRSRHESLAATIEWSHDLLDERERHVFDRLSVFHSPFDLAAAEAVVSGGSVPTQEIADILAALTDASMLAPRRTADGSASFRLLDVIRAYARSQLSETERVELARRHAVHFLGLVAATSELAFTPRHTTAVEHLGLVDADLVAALEWALDTDPVLLSPDVVAGFVYYWYRGGKPADAYRFGHRLTAADQLDPMAIGSAHVAVAFGSTLVGDFDGAVAAGAMAVPIIEGGNDWRMQVFAYNAQGQSAVLAGIPGQCAAMGARILAVCDEHGQVLPRAYGLALLGEEEFFQGGDLRTAERLLSEAIPLFEAIGDAVAQNLFGLGILAAVEAVEGKLDAAERHAAEAASLGGPGWSATALIVLAAFVLIPTDDLDRAEDVLLTGLGRVHERSMLAWTQPALLMLGRVAAARGDWEQAARLLGAARPGVPAWARHPMFWADEPYIRAELGDDRYDAVTTIAAAGDLDALVAELVARP